MRYFENDDYELSYNKSAVSSAVNSAERKITDICKNINNLEYLISELENNAHDKVGTHVDEDYKDYERILGEDALTGLVSNISKDLDYLKQEMSQYERTVSVNAERKRREEMAKRKANM